MAFTFQDWFCMKPGRNSFLPMIPGDASLIFCHDQIWGHDILASIEAAFAKDEPIKMLIYGDWGVGKTHMLYHIRWWLERHAAEYPVTPIIIEIGDLTKVSRFDEVSRPFLDKIGLDETIKLVHDYRGLRPNVPNALRDAGVSAQVAEAFSKLLLSSPGSPPAPLVSQAFEYLKGRDLGRSAAWAVLVAARAQLAAAQALVDLLCEQGTAQQPEQQPGDFDFDLVGLNP
jgi:hypothetical protein